VGLLAVEENLVDVKALRFNRLTLFSLNDVISASAEIKLNGEIDVNFSLFMVVSTYAETGHFGERDRTLRRRSD
jgi:hypothetical protein